MPDAAGVGHRLAGPILPAAMLLGPFVLGETNLQETMPLVWTMVAISAAGAAVTFGVLTYALWKFRDPKVKGRRYG